MKKRHLDSFEGICNRHQQSTRMKVYKKKLPYGLRPWRGWQACWQCMICQINRRPSPNQSKTDIYVFSVIFHSPPLFLKKFTKIHIRWSNGYFSNIENIQIHHYICLLLILPFEIDFTLSGICFLRTCDFVTFSRNMIFQKEVSIV